MSARIASGVAQTILRVTVRTAEQAEQSEQQPPGTTQTTAGGGTTARLSGNGEPAPPPAKGKLGRNDPCWCGSGKKFKKCHGR